VSAQREGGTEGKTKSLWARKKEKIWSEKKWSLSWGQKTKADGSEEIPFLAGVCQRVESRPVRGNKRKDDYLIILSKKGGGWEIRRSGAKKVKGI